MKALISGAGGFIGYALAKYLAKQDYEVYGLDLKYPEFGPTDGIFHRFYILDLRRQMEVDRFYEQLPLYGDSYPDEIYHLAADMGGIGFISKPELFYEIAAGNALIDIHMLEFAKRCPKLRRFFYSSSACAYPRFKQHELNAPALKESDIGPPYDPEPGYGMQKLQTELLCADSGLPVRVARFHNAFGVCGTYGGGREKAPAALCRKVVEATDGGSIEVWGDGCQPAGEFVFVDNQFQPVEETTALKSVLTTEGLVSSIVEVSHRKYVGALVTIKGVGLLPLRFTPDHPLRICRLRTTCRASVQHHCKPQCWCLDRQKYRTHLPHEIDTEQIWTPAERVRKGDYLLIPRIKSVEPGWLNLADYVKPKCAKNRRSHNIRLNLRIANLLGWYVAEGSTTWYKNKHNAAMQGRITFSLGWHERNVAEQLVATLQHIGVHAKIRKRGLAGLEVNARSTHLGAWLDVNCGHGAHAKKIPSCIFDAEPLLCEAFLAGLFHGDGHRVTIDKNTYTLSSVSKALLLGGQLLLAKLGLFGWINWSMKRASGVLEYSLRGRPRRQAWTDADYLYVPVRSTETIDYVGEVFNLETVQHTYATPIVAHNSQQRSFIYIDDLVEGIHRLTQQAVMPGPINLGSDRMVSINELAQMAIAASGKKLTIRNIPGPEGVRSRNSDNSLAQALLDWEPAVTLETGMAATHDWIYEQIHSTTK